MPDAPPRAQPPATVPGKDGVVRCAWCAGDPAYQAYHDEEWGFPVADGQRLFEKLCLEGFQAGLSWLTILRRRESFRRAFLGFEPERVARLDDADVERLLADASIIRHRGKIEAVINNARRLGELERDGISLAHHVWSFAPPDPAATAATADVAAAADVPPPAVTPESAALAADLRRRGWRFVGPTTVYAFMQSMGLVNDHHPACAIHPVVQAARARFVVP